MKTPEHKLWEWLEKNLTADSWGVKDSRQVYNYVTKYWRPKPSKPLTKKK